MLNNSFEYYELLIILVIVIIGGTIVSDEFNKGTIKLLLVKPHKRWKILLSKLLAAIILIFVLTILTTVIQFVTGGIVYGFDDYNIPLIKYDFRINKVLQIDVFSNVLKLLMAKLPMYLIVLSFSVLISCITNNASISIILSMLIYLSKHIVNLKENTEFFKYFIPANWDFTKYLYGNLPEVNYLNLKFSLLICLVGFILILCIIKTLKIYKIKDSTDLIFGIFFNLDIFYIKDWIFEKFF